MIEMLRKARVRERLYSVAAIDAVSMIYYGTTWASLRLTRAPTFRCYGCWMDLAFSCKCAIARADIISASFHYRSD